MGAFMPRRNPHLAFMPITCTPAVYGRSSSLSSQGEGAGCEGSFSANRGTAWQT